MENLAMTVDAGYVWIDLMIYGNAYVSHGERLPPQDVKITPAGYTYRLRKDPETMVDLLPTEVHHFVMDEHNQIAVRKHADIDWGLSSA